jgi:hypothetical protein
MTRHIYNISDDGVVKERRRERRGRERVGRRKRG